MNVKGTILNPASKPQFDQSRFATTATSYVQLNNLVSGGQTPQNHASAVKPANYSTVTTSNSNSALARIQQLQSNSSKQTYLASSTNHPLSIGIANTSKGSIDPQSSPGLKGNSSMMSGVSMSGLSENLVRYQKQSFKLQDSDDKIKSIVNLNPGMANQMQGLNKASKTSGGQHVKQTQIQTHKIVMTDKQMNEGPILHQKNNRTTHGGNTIFKAYSNQSQQYENSVKSLHHSAFSGSVTPTKSDLNLTDDATKEGIVRQYTEQMSNQQKMLKANNTSHRQLPTNVLASTYQMQMTTNGKTPQNKVQSKGKQIHQQMQVILKSKSPEPSLNAANLKNLQQKTPFQSKASPYPAQTLTAKSPIDPILKSVESQSVHGSSKNESIVCPIYPSKDFRLINPTTVNTSKYSDLVIHGTWLKQADDLEYSQQVLQKQTEESHAHKAKSPNPNTTERLKLDQHQYSKMGNKSERRSSTLSREPTVEDVYMMTQRAQQAIIAGKNKKHKKAEQSYGQSIEEQLAQQVAVEQYFEGMDQTDTKKSVRSGERKPSKKSSLSRLEAERYLKILSMSQLEQLEKSSPATNFKGQLTDSTEKAYQTKVKSKSQSGIHPNKETSAKKNAEISQSISATSSQDHSIKKVKRRVRMRSSDANNSQHSSTSPAKKANKQLRKSAISPTTALTLQEPSAKALPTSKKVKINVKFNKMGSNGDKQISEKKKPQQLNLNGSKKNLLHKKQIVSTEKVTQSPQQKVPGIARQSIQSSSIHGNSKKSIQFQDAPIGVEGETKQLTSKQIYGIRSNEKLILRDSFEQAQLSPIAQYYNHAPVQTTTNAEQQKHSNSQLFSIAQLRQSAQTSKLSILNDTNEKLLSNDDRIAKKRASTISSRKDEQASSKGRKDENAQVFTNELATQMNFRSTSPTHRDTLKPHPFNDLKLKDEILSEKVGFKQQKESSQLFQKKVIQILKRTSISPPKNLLFSLPADASKPSTGVENLLNLFPKSSPKVSPDPKQQILNFNLNQIKSVLSASASVNVIKNLNADILQKLNQRVSPKVSQKQHIAEMAIHQKVLRLSRPTSNDVIKTFQIAKKKFLSPEIKLRDVISPENLLNRKNTSSPQLSNKSNNSGTAKGAMVKKSGQSTTKSKTNSQLGASKVQQSAQSIQNVVNTSGSARALFNSKNQAEVVLNRVSVQSKAKVQSNKESVVKPSAGGSGKHHRKVPTVTATVPLTKAQSQASQPDQLMISQLKSNQQLFKKSTLQKSSVIANAAKKHQLQDGVDAADASPRNADDMPEIQIFDIVSQPRITKVEKSSKSSLIKKVPEEETKQARSPVTKLPSPKKANKSQILIGDQVFSESSKKRPILNQITEASEMTPVVKSRAANPNNSMSRSMVSMVQSDKEQLQFNRDLQKLVKMFRLHFKQFNQAPPTTCEFYRIGRVLGKGAFGKVNFAMHKLSEQLVAIKSMSKETLQSEEDLKRRTKLEMGILQQSNHPNVVRLFDTFETQKHICFVMELCSGGDLFSYIKKRRRLKEDVARFFFRQIIEGLAYIHNAKLVVHRDIKLENILLDATGQVKICDFGVSRQLKTEKQVMHEQCGTPAYIAPEILLDKGYSGFKVDMWSAGVCLYAMLIGSVPFKAATMAALQELIIKGEYDLKFQTSANSNKMTNPKAASTILSDDVKDLIKRLLQIDPAKRLSAIQALEHPWLKDTPQEFDVFTDKEKTLIQKEYMRLNLKRSRIKESLVSSRHSNSVQETEQALFTEHNLETKMAEEDEPQMQNQEEKSYILAPFNSIKSMFIETANQPAQEKLKEQFKWPDEIIKLIVPRRVIKFAKKCREKNRIYEQNNNADLDNGVYNEFVNEQEKEEGELYKKESDESEDEQAKKLSKKSDESDQINLLNDLSSEDSLQKSFHATELSSDDEKADKQIKATQREWEQKQQNKAVFNLYDNEEETDLQLFDKKTPPCVPGVSPTRKFRQTIGPCSAAQKVLSYQEKEFFIDQAVIAQIEQMNVIPKSYLLQELGTFNEKQQSLVNMDPKPNRKMNYVTALYYLLMKRQELQLIQAKQRAQ